MIDWNDKKNVKASHLRKVKIHWFYDAQKLVAKVNNHYVINMLENTKLVLVLECTKDCKFFFKFKPKSFFNDIMK